MIRIMGLFRDGLAQTCSGPQDRRHQDVSLRENIAEAQKAATDAHDFLWIALTDPSSSEIEMIAEFFELPPLLLEDATSRQQRARIDVSPESLFVLLKVLEWAMTLRMSRRGRSPASSGRATPSR